MATKSRYDGEATSTPKPTSDRADRGGLLMVFVLSVFGNRLNFELKSSPSLLASNKQFFVSQLCFLSVRRRKERGEHKGEYDSY